MPQDNNVLIVLTSGIRHAGKTWARREPRFKRLINGRSGSTPLYIPDDLKTNI
jgi:hypothetical protein